MAKLNELLEELAAARAETNSAQEVYKILAAKRDALQQRIHDGLKEAGIKSVSSNDFTVSIAKKPKFTIEDEKSTLEWLGAQDSVSIDDYVKPKLDKTMFDKLAAHTLKETGEIIPGTSFEETEYLSLRVKKEGK